MSLHVSGAVSVGLGVLLVVSPELVLAGAKCPHAVVVNRRAVISDALRAHTKPRNPLVGDIKAEFET